jgi:hypothetical protein
MSEDHDRQKLEEQTDIVNFVAGILFLCIVVWAAHGMSDMIARGMMARGEGGRTWKVFRFAALYVFPGLMAGFVWRKWGVLIGVGVAGVVRIVSVFSLKLTVAYQQAVKAYFDGEGEAERTMEAFFKGMQEGKHKFAAVSFETAAETMGSFHGKVLLSIGAGVLFAMVGWLIVRNRFGEFSWYQLLRKIGPGLLAIPFVVAGGIWIGGIVHLRHGAWKVCQWAATSLAHTRPYIGWVLWAGLAITAACGVLAALSYGLPTARRGSDETPSGDEASQEE